MIALISLLLLQAAAPSNANVALQNEAVTRCILQAAEEARGGGAQGDAVADAAARACDEERIALRAATVELMTNHGLERARAESIFDRNFQRQVESLVETGDWAPSS